MKTATNCSRASPFGSSNRVDERLCAGVWEGVSWGAKSERASEWVKDLLDVFSALKSFICLNQRVCSTTVLSLSSLNNVWYDAQGVTYLVERRIMIHLEEFAWFESRMTFSWECHRSRHTLIRVLSKENHVMALLLRSVLLWLARHQFQYSISRTPATNLQTYGLKIDAASECCLRTTVYSTPWWKHVRGRPTLNTHIHCSNLNISNTNEKKTSTSWSYWNKKLLAESYKQLDGLSLIQKGDSWVFVATTPMVWTVLKHGCCFVDSSNSWWML